MTIPTKTPNRKPVMYDVISTVYLVITICATVYKRREPAV